MSTWKDGIDARSILYSCALNCKYRFVISVIAKREIGEIEKLTLILYLITSNSRITIRTIAFIHLEIGIFSRIYTTLFLNELIYISVSYGAVIRVRFIYILKEKEKKNHRSRNPRKWIHVSLYVFLHNIICKYDFSTKKRERYIYIYDLGNIF